MTATVQDVAVGAGTAELAEQPRRRLGRLSVRTVVTPFVPAVAAVLAWRLAQSRITDNDRAQVGAILNCHVLQARLWEHVNLSAASTGLAMAVDNTVSMVSLLRNMEEFFARESCGWCTPCRDGLPWSVKLLRALEKGEGAPGDIEILQQLVDFLGPGKTYCAHAPGAVEPLGTALKHFRSEFEQGISASAPRAERPAMTGVM